MDLLERAEQLSRARVPYVRATVVRALHPTSAHAGDTALVHVDGTVEGFVGGTCAEAALREHSLAVLVTGDPLLLRITPGPPETSTEEGVVTVANPCVSGGTLELLLEPRRPPARMVVVGDTPVARALLALGVPLGLDVGGAYEGAAAVVVASHGRGEEPALEAALRAGVPYVGLVASRTRAAAVLGALDVSDADRVHSPAGLALGCRTAPEIALSVLAELVGCGVLHAAAPLEPPVAVTAVDPVCGMTVTVTGDTPTATVDGVQHWFCCPHCRATSLSQAGG